MKSKETQSFPINSLSPQVSQQLRLSQAESRNEEFNKVPQM